MWFFLALVSAILAGVRRTSEKQLLHQINQFTLGWTIQLLSLPIIVGSLLVTGTFLNPLTLGLNFWVPILIGMIGFYPLHSFLSGRAIKHGELSKVLPVQSLGPVFATLFGWLILHQTPTLVALGAIGLTSCGLCILNMPGRTLHNPWHMFAADSANRYMVLDTALIAAIIPIDALAIRASNPATYAIVSTISATAILYAAARIAHHDALPPVRLWRPLVILGSMQGAAYITVVIAMTLGPIAYISAVKSSAMLIGAVSGIIVLKERVRPQKIVAFGLIGLGLTILALAG